jgi:tripeptidyl-peptidase-1
MWSLADGEPITGDYYLVWLTYLIKLDKVPSTISISYGANENGFPKSYATFICNLYMELGARGVSILYSSGDDGVGSGDCKNNLGKVQFIPKFPASCMLYLSLQAVHKRRHMSLTTSPLIRRSLYH